MTKVKIADVRGIITFSGIDITAEKHGSGLIHLFSNTDQDMSNFAGVARSQGVEVAVNGTYAYVSHSLVGA